MEKKMSKNKEAFMDSIEIRYRDYRENPTHSRELRKLLGEEYLKKVERIKEKHLKKAMWLLRNCIDSKEGLRLTYVDGETLVHCNTTLNLQYQGKYKGILFLSSCTSMDWVIDGQKIVEINMRGLKVEDFFKEIRKIRDLIKTA